MQRLNTISLLALYLLASLGIHGVSHFCGDQLVGVALYASDKDGTCQDDACCSLPDPEEECCTELQFSHYFESERAFANLAQRTWIKIPVPGVNLCTDIFISDTPFEIREPSDIDTPYIRTTTPLYIRHQSLIFYG